MIEWFDIGILNFFQSIANPVLDDVFVWITFLGDSGILWIVLGCIMAATKKYRKYGLALLITMVIGFLIGNLALKNLIARPRPCWRNSEIVLLISNPKDFSFPSGHSMHSFIGATMIWFANRKWGIAAFILAGLIAVSRIYLQVHYPTDVLAGVLLGIVLACGVHLLICKSKRGEICIRK